MEELADFDYLNRGELCLVMRSTTNLALLTISISDVVVIAAKEEMTGIDTVALIT